MILVQKFDISSDGNSMIFVSNPIRSWMGELFYNHGQLSSSVDNYNLHICSVLIWRRAMVSNH